MCPILNLEAMKPRTRQAVSYCRPCFRKNSSVSKSLVVADQPSFPLSNACFSCSYFESAKGSFCVNKARNSFSGNRVPSFAFCIADSKSASVATSSRVLPSASIASLWTVGFSCRAAVKTISSAALSLLAASPSRFSRRPSL